VSAAMIHTETTFAR